MEDMRVKREKKQHQGLMKLLKKHFMKDEDEMEDMDEEMGEEPEEMYDSLGVSPDGDEEEESDFYDKLDSEIPEQEDEYEDDFEGEDEDEGEEAPAIPKEHRKKMAVAVISKKMSKPKKKMQQMSKSSHY